ncbi:hypothetical protein Trydic_g7556 [Trypoxylus dichotomus]
MRCANSFCLIVFLYYIVHLCAALPLPHENDSDDGYIVEIDPSMLHAVELSTKKPVKFVTAIVRNKRNFDYSDYSSSSEEGNGFGGYVSKPYLQGFAHFWKFSHRPTIRADYEFWHPQPTIPYVHPGYNYFRPHYHHHHHKNCKHPFDHSSESEETGRSDFPETKNFSTSSESALVTTDPTTTTITTTVPTTTSRTAITTTTEYIPVIDIRSSN